MEALQTLDYIRVADERAAAARPSRAKEPLTLAGVPTGFLPWLAADLARAAHGTAKRPRGRHRRRRSGDARAGGHRAAVRARGRGSDLPGWDCLPYDRASPGAAGDGRAAGDARARSRPSATSRSCSSPPPTRRPSALLTPFRIRQLTRRIAEGERIEREALVEQLNALGYQRADTVAEHGEYAVRGSLIDLFPAGEDMALRLDFFGDEIDSLRRFDPADQRSTDKAEAFTLMPASEALARRGERSSASARAIARQFGATATGDPLYQALSEGRRMAGMEHWLPLLEERLTTLFDHLGENDVDRPRQRRRRGARGAARGDRGLLRTTASGRWTPSPAAIARSRPTRSTCQERVGRGSSPSGRSTSPRPSPSRKPTQVIDFGVEPARDFAPERAQQAQCLRSGRRRMSRKLRKSGHKVVLASYTAAPANGSPACSRITA